MKKITFLILLIFTISMQGQDKLASSVNQYLDGSNWVDSNGSNYEYDSNGNLTSQTELSWNSELEVWENSYQSIYTYNANNKVTEELEKQWNSNTNQFENSYKTTYTYNLSGDLTESISEDWTSGSWINKYKDEYIYDSGKISDYISSVWQNGGWVQDEKATITYNANNRIEESIGQELVGGIWVDSYRDLFYYDANNKISYKVYENWNGLTWEEDERVVYTLDSNSNRTKEIVTYDGGGYEENYFFHPTNLMSNFAHPFKDTTGLYYITEDFPYYNQLISSSRSSNDRTIYDYNNALVLSVNQNMITDNQIKVFPNPVSDIITIESSMHAINKIELYNTLGSKVFSTNENIFNISFLNTGVYFLNITSDEGSVVTQKIVKN